MRSKDWNKALAGLLLAPVPLVARAETYLTEDQAAAVLFPGITMEARWMDLSPEEVKAIQKSSRDRLWSPRIRIFWGPHKEALIIDRVLGKHEFITYAAAIDAEGKVKGLEIMDYRETYGSQIRGKEWRQAFAGKSVHDPVKLDQDIPNLSGATLSSAHVTNGMYRLLRIYELLKSKV